MTSPKRMPNPSHRRGQEWRDLPEDWMEFVEDRISRAKVEARRRSAEDRKTVDEVFDKTTLLTLWKFINDGIFETLDYPLSTGKEANVFHASTRGGEGVAVKIFRTNTATFRSFMQYIVGDPRFGNVRPDRREMVYTWAQKEYKNLQRYFEVGARVPQPIAFRANCLVMEFIGHEGTPSPLLKDAHPEDPQACYEYIVEHYRRGSHEGRLAHGDLSEFNILNHGDGDYVLIDVAQAVLLRHPMARELLERDARNLSRFFRKLGVDCTYEQTLETITPPSARAAIDKEEGDEDEGDEEE